MPFGGIRGHPEGDRSSIPRKQGLRPDLPGFRNLEGLRNRKDIPLKQRLRLFRVNCSHVVASLLLRKDIPLKQGLRHLVLIVVELP